MNYHFIMVSKLEQTLRDMESTELILRERNMWNDGGFLWMPNGMVWKEEVYSKFINILKRNNFKPFQIPRIVPSQTIETVKENLKDFTEKVYWLTKKQGKSFTEPKGYMNTTTDPVLNNFLSLALKKRPNLIPFKGYFREQLFRPHKHSSNPFINADENSDIIEAYSIHFDKSVAEKEFNNAIDMTQQFFNQLGIYSLTIDHPIMGDKNIAQKVTSIQTILPQLNCSTRMGTIYFHDQTFSKMFNVHRRIKNRKKEYAHQVGFGFGERFLLTLLDHHKDEYGFCFNPDIAPIQVAIIPMKEEFNQQAYALAEKINYRTEVYESQKKQFRKTLTQHLKMGTPIRITINENNTSIEYSRRDTLKHEKIEQSSLIQKLPIIFKEMGENYRERSKDLVTSQIIPITSKTDLRGLLNEKKLANLNYCGSKECIQILKNNFNGEFLGEIRGQNPSKNCIVCNNKSSASALYGRRSPSP